MEGCRGYLTNMARENHVKDKLPSIEELIFQLRTLYADNRGKEWRMSSYFSLGTLVKEAAKQVPDLVQSVRLKFGTIFLQPCTCPQCKANPVAQYCTIVIQFK